MQPYRCGCAVEPRGLSDYCPAHWLLSCHNGPETTLREGECPPCRRARFLSIGLAPALGHLAKARDESLGGEPAARLAEPGEHPDYLTRHSKVRSAA